MSVSTCVSPMAVPGPVSRANRVCSSTGRASALKISHPRHLLRARLQTTRGFHPGPSQRNSGGSTTSTSASAGSRGAAAAAAEPPAPEQGFGVVITGGTKGVGYALAREFLSRGDRVCICGRSQVRVDAAVRALRNEFPGQCVSGTACDVTDPRDVDKLGDYATTSVGTIHHWLNNAGMVSARESLLNVEPSEVVQVRVGALGFRV